MKRLFTWLMAAFVGVVLVGTLSRTVFLALSLRSSYQGAAFQTGSALFWSGMLALGLAVVAAYVLSRTLARPVEEITRFARRLGRGDFSGEVRVQSVEEVNELAATLTSVSAQLRHSFGALSEERQRLATVLQSMQEGVLVLDVAGDLALMNEAAVQMLHCPQPVLPTPIGAAAWLPARLREALAEAAGGTSVEVYLRPQGREDVLAVCSPAPSPGGGTGAVAVLHDLGAVMRLQRLRENFIADVAHELRGPLANLSILSEALGDGTIPWDGREPYVQSLQAEVTRLHRLSQDVLDLARMDAGVMTPTIDSVDLAGVAASVKFRLAARATAAEVSLAVGVPEDLRVLASPDQLERVIFNLVENAIRHTPAGGTVTICAAREGGRVALTVADNGPGIPSEHLAYIFERFYKVDPARTRTDAGTGLGLAVVKQLVELQGGTVAVESEVGQGSVFSVILPTGTGEQYVQQGGE